MKNLKYLAMILLGAGLILTSCNQAKKSKKEEGENSKVPETVQKVFQAKFAEAKDVEWKTEEEGEYEAEFTLNDTKMSADFTQDGTWKETETKTDYSRLPSSVLDTLSAKFKDYTVENMTIDKSETPEGTFWEVKLKKDDQVIEVVFSDDGAVVKQKAEEGEEEVGESSEHHEKGEKEEEGKEEHEKGEK